MTQFWLSLIILLGSVIGAVLLIASYHIFRRDQRLYYFLERHLEILWMILVVGSIGFIGYLPSCAIPSLIRHSFIDPPTSILLTQNFFQFAFFYGFCLLLMTRCWLWYFDRKYSEATATAYSFGTVHLQNLSKNWFVVHLHNFGSKMWIIKYLFIPSWLSLTVITMSIIALTDHSISHSIHLLFGFLLSAVLIIASLRIKQKDSYGIRRELRCVFIHFQCFLLIQITMTILHSVNVIEKGISVVTDALSTFYLCTVFVYCPIIGAKSFVNATRSNQDVIGSINRWLTSHSARNRSSDSTKSGSGSLRNPFTDPFGWQNCIQFAEIYKEYMEFLEQEFASESLLFLTEYVQLKNYLQRNVLFSTAFIEHNISFTIKLPESESLPLFRITAAFKSSFETALVNLNILCIDDMFTLEETFNSETIPCFISAFQQIENEYLIASASRELNISSKQKKKLSTAYRHVFQDTDTLSTESFMSGILLIFIALENIVKSDISGMLHDSFVRFRKKQCADLAMDRETTFSFQVNRMLHQHRTRNQSMNQDDLPNLWMSTNRSSVFDSV